MYRYKVRERRDPSAPAISMEQTAMIMVGDVEAIKSDDVKFTRPYLLDENPPTAMTDFESAGSAQLSHGLSLIRDVR
jgi:hypothetical protein